MNGTVPPNAACATADSDLNQAANWAAWFRSEIIESHRASQIGFKPFPKSSSYCRICIRTCKMFGPWKVPSYS